MPTMLTMPMDTTWDSLKQAVQQCDRCPLSSTRTQTVFGDGNQSAPILFVGEGPGEQEDLSGVPFVGPAGQLFDRMLAAIEMDRSDVYIANIVKCRPPQNRDPKKEEADTCIHYLREQLKLLNPKIIICLGRVAAQAIIRADFKITAERGTWLEKKGFYMMATFHPSALLRDESKKFLAWQDFKKIKTKRKEIAGI